MLTQQLKAQCNHQSSVTTLVILEQHRYLYVHHCNNLDFKAHIICITTILYFEVREWDQKCISDQ